MRLSGQSYPARKNNKGSDVEVEVGYVRNSKGSQCDAAE